MKVKLHASVIPPFRAPAEADVVRFSGSVQRDSTPATPFDVSIRAGKTSKIVLADGTALEFSVTRRRRRETPRRIDR